MARPLSRRRLLRHIESLEPAIRDEFLRAIRDVRNEAQVGLIAELLEAGQVDAAATALGINEARFAELAEKVRSAYLAGGRVAAAEMPVLWADPTSLMGAYRGARRLRLTARFDMRNPRAEAWLSEHSAKLIREIVDDQRNMIRAALLAGMEAGRNPNQTAMDIVGRISGGRRQGGLIGLTTAQAQWVTNARRALLSGNPAEMAAYFTRQRRDKRFDAMVRRAIESGRPVPEAATERIAGRYADRLLALRGETIGRTEAHNAFAEAREEAFRQTVDAGGLNPDNVRKVWSATMDSRTRDAHAGLNGVEVGLNDAFESPTGARMLHPGDTSMGAGPEDVIGCRCLVQYRIDMAAETMGNG